jgi:hypothetical protein
MAIYKHVSSKEVIRKVFRDLQPSSANFIHDGIEWMGEALEHIGASSQLCQKQVVINIKDHKGYLPGDLYYINQVAVNTCVTPAINTEIDTLLTQVEVLNGNLSQYYTEVNEAVTLSSNGTYNSSLTSTDLTTFDSYHNTNITQLRDINSRIVVLENMFFGGGSSGNCLRPLQYGASTFHASIHCDGCVNMGASYKDTYIIDCGMVKTSFESGSVCISYMAFPTDAECYPLVPDNISYREAMFWYITKKLLMQGVKLKAPFNYEYAEHQWKYYCTQARNAANYPDIDRMESFMSQWVRLTPNMNRDLSFFETLNDREQFTPDNI